MVVAKLLKTVVLVISTLQLQFQIAMLTET